MRIRIRAPTMPGREPDCRDLSAKQEHKYNGRRTPRESGPRLRLDPPPLSIRGLSSNQCLGGPFCWLALRGRGFKVRQAPVRRIEIPGSAGDFGGPELEAPAPESKPPNSLVFTNLVITRIWQFYPSALARQNFEIRPWPGKPPKSGPEAGHRENQARACASAPESKPPNSQNFIDLVIARIWHLPLGLGPENFRNPVLARQTFKIRPRRAGF